MEVHFVLESYPGKKGDAESEVEEALVGDC